MYKKASAICLFIIGLFSATSFAQSSQNISMIYHWHDSSIVGSAAFNNAYNEVWGFTEGGREYGVIGSTDGTHIFDVTNTSQITMVDFVPGHVQGPVIIHRDYHDYNGYMYIVADEGLSTLKIVDLSYLPDSVHVVYNSDNLLVRAHNIFIDTATAKMYVCATFSNQRGYNGLEIYDLANPLSPVLLHTENNFGTVHDIYVKNDIAYLNCGNTHGLQIVDYSNTTSPVTLGSLTNYIFQGYNHSGWLSDDGLYYAFADETHGMEVKLASVSDPTNIGVSSTFTSGSHANSIPHNLMIKGDYAYVSYYYDGIQIFNISDPANPYKAGFYDTSPLTAQNQSYEGAWGVYSYLPSGIVLVSDMQNGFWVFDVSMATTGVGLVEDRTDISVFPNPVDDQLNIRFEVPSIDEVVQVQIHDMAGRLVYTANEYVDGNHLKLDLNLNAGLYTLTLHGSDFVLNSKLTFN